MPRINKKTAESAFSLMELLITIAIIGVISIIALPAVSQLKDSNDKTEYKAYEKSFVYSGKQYNDAYSEDLFGNVKSGCVDVTYQQLEERKLIKNIQIEHATCRGSNDLDDTSKVRIRRAGDIYYYELFMECLKDEESIYKTKNWNRRNESCEINSTPAPTPFNPTPEPVVGDQKAPTMSITMKFNGSVVNEANTYEITNKNDLKVTVVVEDSGSGLAKNNQLTYTWQYKGTNITGFVNKVKTFNPDNNGMNKATISLEVPNRVQDTDVNGTFKVIVTPSKIRDNNNNTMKTNVTQSKSIKVNNLPEPPGVPSTPSVLKYKWKDNKTTPSNSSGLSKYSSGWSSLKIYTEPSGGGKNVAYYEYWTKGATTNKKNQRATHRNIAAQKTSTIRYRACNSLKQCSKYSNEHTIKIDLGVPHCSISKSNTGKTSGVTLKIKCTDKVSGVAKCAGDKKGGKDTYTVTKSPIKKSHEYNVKDEAGNTNSCKVTVKAQRQKQTRSWNSCKTYYYTYSCKKGCANIGKGNCSCSYSFGRYDDCQKSWCHKVKKGTCQYGASFGNINRIACNVVIPANSKKHCSGGYNSWSSWKNVSSCKESKTVNCRTVYK